MNEVNYATVHLPVLQNWICHGYDPATMRILFHLLSWTCGIMVYCIMLINIHYHSSTDLKLHTWMITKRKQINNKNIAVLHLQNHHAILNTIHVLSQKQFSQILGEKSVRNETDNTVNYKCKLETTYTSFSVPISQNSKSYLKWCLNVMFKYSYSFNNK